MTYEKIKDHYINKRWEAWMVQKAVEKGIITLEQAKEIIEGK